MMTVQKPEVRGQTNASCLEGSIVGLHLSGRCSHICRLSCLHDRVKLTHISANPASVDRTKPIEGPTVWYGADLTPEDVEYRCTIALC